MCFSLLMAYRAACACRALWNRSGAMRARASWTFRSQIERLHQFRQFIDLGVEVGREGFGLVTDRNVSEIAQMFVQVRVLEDGYDCRPKRADSVFGRFR